MTPCYICNRKDDHKHPEDTRCKVLVKALYFGRYHMCGPKCKGTP